MKNELKKVVKLQMDTICNPVRSTLGVCGSTVLIHEYGTSITKDGVSVARAIKRMHNKPVINIIQQVSERTVEKAGDGTTSSIVFAHALYNYLSEFEFSNKELVRKYLNNYAKQAKEFIDKHKVFDFNPKDIAMISTNGDEVISQLIHNIYTKVGEEGTINVKSSDLGFDSVQYGVGMKWKSGYVSSVFINNPQTNSCEFENVKILLYNSKISYLTQDTINALSKYKNNNILMIVPDIDMSALQVLSRNKLNGLNLCVIKIPGFRNYKTENIEDLKAFMSNIDFMEKVIVTKNETIFIQSKGNKESLKIRTESLKDRLNRNDEDIKDLKKRINNINSTYADLYIGGNSEVEIKERIDRAEDAICAVKSAYNGVVIGGGNIYKQMVFDDIFSKPECKEEKIAYISFTKALLSIQEQILANYQSIDDYKYGSISLSKNPIIFSEDGDLIDCDNYSDLSHGVIDPADVIKLVIENGVSVVGTLISISDIIDNFTIRDELNEL